MRTTKNILGLDVGNKRIGVAIARQPVLLPVPLTTLNHDEKIMNHLLLLISEQAIGRIVVGLPRGLNGQETQQTEKSREFAKKLEARAKLPVVLQDEAATSLKAEAELKARSGTYNKEQIDSLAAVYILEDYVTSLGAS